MILLPCWVTSDSATPEPLTRSSMIARASFIDCSLGSPSATRVIRVPPCRSRPSSGFQDPARATRPKMIAVPRRNTTRVRPGRADVRAMSVLLGLVGNERWLDDRPDGAAGDLDGHPVGDPDPEVLVGDLRHGGEDAGGEHHLVPDLQRSLHGREFPLPPAGRPDDEEPEQQGDAEDRHEGGELLHRTFRTSRDSGTPGGRAADGRV